MPPLPPPAPLKKTAASILLAVAVLLVFWQTVHFDFVNFDDNAYVYANHHVLQGLSVESVEWAFTHIQANNWHPLTTLSHMLDCTLYGPNPAAHHLENVLLHAAAAVLLFLALSEMTGDWARSAFAAAVFAIHPLRVESVAWISERKDVLSGFFFMLVMLAYVRWTRGRRSLVGLVGVAALFALGLMSKPMLITVPFVLLLLDFWPLRRLGEGRARFLDLVAEKVPLLLLVAASLAATVLAQQDAYDHIPAVVSLPWRVANAAVSACVYIGQTFWPVRLAVLYPHPGVHLAIWKIVASILALAAVSASAILWRKRYPWLLVGWFWFLGMLVPVCGIVQVGVQAHADRYTYLPQIGLLMMIVWSLPQAVVTRLLPRLAAGSVIMALMLCAVRQTAYWRDSETLWRHTLAVTSGNGRAHNIFALWLISHGRSEEAVNEYNEALRSNPQDTDAQTGLGNTLAKLGRYGEAVEHYRKAVEIDPERLLFRINLARALGAAGRDEEAFSVFQEALKIPDASHVVHVEWGELLSARGRVEEAIAHYKEAVKIRPDYAKARALLTQALASGGR